MDRYNLILYHVPERQCISDFITIRHIMVGRAPDIQVHVLSTGSAVPTNFWQVAAAKPSLLFSFADIRLNAPVRGAQLISHSLTKLEEIALVSAAGFAVPETRLITPETRLDEVEWGPFTVIKPNRGIPGRGVQLVRTRNVRWTDTAVLSKDNPHHRQQLLAQRFVGTGPFITSYRVMTVLGKPIYCVTSKALDKPSRFHTSDTTELDVSAANDMTRKMTLSSDSEVIDLATSLHAALPHLPVMGVDIIREEDTGRLFILEFNSHGLVWHLSSKLGFRQQRENGVDFYGQFNALGTIADALIEATRDRAT